MISVSTQGCRQAKPEFFEESGLRTEKELKHTPALVFVPGFADLLVRVETTRAKLLSYPDETRVLMAWSGQWRSDFFTFTVGDLKAHLAAHPRQPYQALWRSVADLTEEPRPIVLPRAATPLGRP